MSLQKVLLREDISLQHWSNRRRDVCYTECTVEPQNEDLFITGPSCQETNIFVLKVMSQILQKDPHTMDTFLQRKITLVQEVKR